MQFSTLGSSDLSVSRICLGSMTWGVQNNQKDADEQINYALSQGINFIDTAEMYAVPPSPETYGKTEKIIGNYIAANPSKRKDFVLASKIAGPGLAWVRDGGPITGQAVIDAVDASLVRLQTDYIDLFQLHWPNRQSPHFGQHAPNVFNFTDLDSEQQTENMLDILQGLDKCIKSGKVRFCGLSDDTPWGINSYLKLSEKHDLPKIVSIQNEFSLLHTKDWPYLIENCVHEDIAYLPWSPMATGMLSGKYLNGARPEGSRFSFNSNKRLFRDTPTSELAIKAYQDIAIAHGISTAQLALKWVDQVNGVTSTIIGATTMDQLKEDIDAFNTPLSGSALSDIATILKQYPVPF
jgi:aryl-alcohol dehydrogenase-like predicted oxidoreductase